MTTRFETLQRTVSIPDQVSVQVEGRTVKVKGPLGSLQEDLSHLPVSIDVNDNKVRLETTWPSKREIGMLGTAAAHVRNMLRGVHRATGTNCAPSTPTFPSRLRWMRRLRC